MGTRGYSSPAVSLGRCPSLTNSLRCLVTGSSALLRSLSMAATIWRPNHAAPFCTTCKVALPPVIQSIAGPPLGKHHKWLASAGVMAATCHSSELGAASLRAASHPLTSACTASLCLGVRCGWRHQGKVKASNSHVISLFIHPCWLLPVTFLPLAFLAWLPGGRAPLLFPGEAGRPLAPEALLSSRPQQPPLAAVSSTSRCRVVPPWAQRAASAHVGAPRRVPGAPVCPLYLNVPCPSPAPRAACLQTIPWARGSAIPETGLAMKTKKVAPDATGTPFQCPLSPDPLPHAGVRRVEADIPFQYHVNKLQRRKSPTKSISTEKNQNILQSNQRVTAELDNYLLICFALFVWIKINKQQGS